MGDRPGFGGLLAEHDVQERHDGDRCRGRHAAAGEEVEQRRERREPVAEQVRDGVFGHIAEQDRRDGDAELGGRELAVQVLKGRLDGPCLAVATPHHRLDAGAPCGDESELGRDEERVREHQRHDREQAQPERFRGGARHRRGNIERDYLGD